MIPISSKFNYLVQNQSTSLDTSHDDSNNITLTLLENLLCFFLVFDVVPLPEDYLEGSSAFQHILFDKTISLQNIQMMHLTGF